MVKMPLSVILRGTCRDDLWKVTDLVQPLMLMLCSLVRVLAMEERQVSVREGFGPMLSSTKLGKATASLETSLEGWLLTYLQTSLSVMRMP